MRSFAFAAIVAVAIAAEKEENQYVVHHGAHYYGTDITPYEYTHGVHQDHESRYPAYERAVVRDIDHSQHRRLDHRYDDRHDVEPVPFHEHRVLRAVDRPESRSYLHHARNEAPEGQESNYYHRVADITPYEYTHGIYQDHESRYPAYERAVVRDIDHS